MMITCTRNNTEVETVKRLIRKHASVDRTTKLQNETFTPREERIYPYTLRVFSKRPSIRPSHSVELRIVRKAKGVSYHSVAKVNIRKIKRGKRYQLPIPSIRKSIADEPREISLSLTRPWAQKPEKTFLNNGSQLIVDIMYMMLRKLRKNNILHSSK